MMRKLSIVLTAVALMAVMATAAFAQPNISGLLYVTSKVTFGDETETGFGGFGRVNISGDVSENVSYYVRVQGGWGSSASGLTGTGKVNIDDDPEAKEIEGTFTLQNNAVVPLAYIDVKNLLGSGSTLRIGRQSLAWYVHNEFGGLHATTENAVSLTMSAADNVTLRGFVTLAENPKLGARAAFATPVGTLGVNVRSEVPGSEREIGYSVDADLSFAGVNVNAELGQTVGSDELNIKIIGVGFDAITDATGWDNFIEYNIQTEKWAVGISKTVYQNLDLDFTVSGGKGADTTLTTELSVSF